MAVQGGEGVIMDSVSGGALPSNALETCLGNVIQDVLATWITKISTVCAYVDMHGNSIQYVHANYPKFEVVMKNNNTGQILSNMYVCTRIKIKISMLRRIYNLVTWCML